MELIEPIQFVVMGLYLPRSAMRIKLCSRCHDTHDGVHLRIVFALGDMHVLTRACACHLLEVMG
jgi:hypothetical protein